MRQIVDSEYIDMSHITPDNFWVALEHLGRYTYAAWLVGKRRFKTVLDAGCANGFGCEKLAENAEHVVGVDIGAGLIDAARNRNCAKTDFHVLDLDAADWAHVLGDMRFDAVTCFETIEHVQSPEHLLGALHARLNPGGRLLLSVPSAEYEPLDEEGKPINPYHRHVLTREACVKLFQASGFKVEKVLGQPGLNRLMRRHNTFCSRQPELAPFTTESFQITPQSLEYYIWMFAMPEKGGIKDAYSLIYILRP